MREGGLDEWRRLVSAHAASEGRELSSDVTEELAAHLADEERAGARSGLPPREARARAAALLNTASFLDIAAPSRRQRARLLTAGLLQDFQLAFRSLRRSPGFAATALITLAIGIGANTAMFSLAHAVLLNSLPVSQANRLYKLGDEFRCCPTETLQGNWSIFSYPFYILVRDQPDAFEEVAAADTLRPDLSVRKAGAAAAAEAYTGEFVSGNYFTTLGVQAAVGRVFQSSDDRAGVLPVAVASYAGWRKLGFDRSQVGQTLTISGVSVGVIGVAPQGFFGDRLERQPPDFWIPMSSEPAFMHESTLLESRSAGWLYIFGRLRSGRTPADVGPRLTSMLRHYLRAPGNVNHEDDVARIDAQVIRLVPGGSGTNAVRREYEQGLWLLLGASTAVLLIACANLANLLLVRAAAARRVTAVELAIGASGWHIVRRQLAEAVVLSTLGGAVGVFSAALASRGIVLIAFRGAPNVPIVTTPSFAVLVFTLAISLAAGACVGAVPAWVAARSDPGEALRGAGRVFGETTVAQRLLAVLQVAASIALVAVAGLLAQSLRNLDRVTYGFEPHGRLIVNIDPQSAGYTQRRLDELYRRIDERLTRAPGVLSASLSLYAPQQEESVWGARIYLDGAAVPFQATWNRVGPRYFEALGTPLVRGRSLDEHDTAESRLVAVINETFARRFFPSQDPIGRHFGKYEPQRARDFEVVGIVKDAKYLEASHPVPPMFFVPLAQRVTYAGELFNKIEESSRYAGAISISVRGDPDAMVPAIRAALADVDPSLAPKRVGSFPEVIRIATRQRTLMARLSEAFGAIALLLAGVGLYGVTAYRAMRRRGEIGLRLALGATRGQVAALVLRGAMGYTVCGLLIGVPITLLTARAIQSQLFGVAPFNPGVLGTSAAVVVGCVLFATIWPARWASRVDPLETLRHE